MALTLLLSLPTPRLPSVQALLLRSPVGQFHAFLTSELGLLHLWVDQLGEG